MLSWLSDLAYFLASFFPRLRIVRSTHDAVRFRCGVPSVVPGGRLIIYWPIVTELVILPKVRQTTETGAQFVTTFDGQSIAISFAVVYRISDVYMAVTETWDIYSVIDDISQTTLSSFVSNLTFKDIQTDKESFNSILTREIQVALSKYGVSVESAQIVSCSACIVLRNIGDWGSSNPGNRIDETTGEKV